MAWDVAICFIADEGTAQRQFAALWQFEDGELLHNLKESPDHGVEDGVKGHIILKVEAIKVAVIQLIHGIVKLFDKGIMKFFWHNLFIES